MLTVLAMLGVGLSWYGAITHEQGGLTPDVPPPPGATPTYYILGF